MLTPIIFTYLSLAKLMRRAPVKMYVGHYHFRKLAWQAVQVQMNNQCLSPTLTSATSTLLLVLQQYCDGVMYQSTRVGRRPIYSEEKRMASESVKFDRVTRRKKSACVLMGIQTRFVAASPPPSIKVLR